MFNPSPLTKYLERANAQGALSSIDAGFVGYLANLTKVAEVMPEMAASVVRELRDQRNNLKLIASENFCSLSCQLAMGNLLTDKYAEGYPFHRFYAGCANVDELEARGVELAKKVFGCEHAYLQAHSGADANLIAFWAILHTRVANKLLVDWGGKKINDLNQKEWAELRKALGNQKLLALDYYSGGHLTHGYRFNVSAQMFDAHSYGVNESTGLLDYDNIEKLAQEIKPLILLAGYSAYPRAINFRRMKEIADKVGAVFMVDMAHFAGLVAGGVFQGDYNPIPFADVVTTTTHKTLRGPRGGMVMCKQEFAEQVDKGCPLVIGGPLSHVMLAKAVALQENCAPDFKDYAKKIVENSQALASACIEQGLKVLTGGTDNHLLLIDVRQFGINGRQAEAAVRECGITLNRNSIPFDPNGAWFTSGLRVGTPAITTLGMGVAEMQEIAVALKTVLAATKSPEIDGGKPSKTKYILDEKSKAQARLIVSKLLERFVLYPELDLNFLEQHFLTN
jgi:glycine hydroxymethyltransferase